MRCFLATIASAIAAVDVFSEEVCDEAVFSSGDALFACGDYAGARQNYAGLVECPGVPRDALLYRLAECDAECGNDARANAKYRLLLSCFPESSFVDEARLRMATIRSRSVEPHMRRMAVADFLDIAYGRGAQPLAEEAELAAATTCHNDGWHKECICIVERALKKHPNGRFTQNLRRIAVWSARTTGNRAAFLRLADGGTDDESIRQMREMARRTDERTLDRASSLAYRCRWSEVDALLAGFIASNGASDHIAEALYLRGVSQWKTGSESNSISLIRQSFAAGLPDKYAGQARILLDYLMTNTVTKVVEVKKNE